MWKAIVNLLRGNRRMQAEGLQDAAASCGLQVVETPGVAELEARAGPLEVRIEACRDKRQRFRIVVAVPGPPDFNHVRIRPESLRPSAWAREIDIGDAKFDSRFFIEGPPGLVFALLDAEMRRLLLRVDEESRLEIAGGKLRVEASRQEVLGVLPLLLDIGRRLARSMEVDASRRLAENAKRDPEVWVRLKNLLILVHELPRDPGTVEALRTACSDPSPEIRLHAAKALDAEGRHVLWKLAESTVADTLSAEAVLALGRDLPFERTKALLDGALARRSLQTARACLQALGRSGAAAAVDTLANMATYEQGDLAAAAAQALGAIDSTSAEPPLILALQRKQKEVRLAAANALGRVGSAAAVLPLKEAAERSSRDPEIRRATRQAIAEIQSRVRGASPGQLSLAATEAGQLSLAEAEGGELSLAVDAGGQVSLATAEPGQLSASGDKEG